MTSVVLALQLLVSSFSGTAFDVSAPNAIRPSLRVTPAALKAFIESRTVTAKAVA